MVRIQADVDEFGTGLRDFHVWQKLRQESQLSNGVDALHPGHSGRGSRSRK